MHESYDSMPGATNEIGGLLMGWSWNDADEGIMGHGKPRVLTIVEKAQRGLDTKVPRCYNVH